MPITPEIKNKISEYEAHYSSSEILDSLANSGKYPDVSEKIKEYRKHYGDDEVLTSLKGAPTIDVPRETSKPEEAGFFRNVNNAIVKRGVNVSDELNAPSQGLYEDIASAPEKALRVTGQAAGLIGDVTGETLKSAYKTVVPDAAQNYLKEKAAAAFNTASGRAVAGAVQKGSQLYGKFEKNYPNAAKDINAVTNIASVMPIQMAGKEGINVAKDVNRFAINTPARLAKKSEKLAEESIDLMQSATKPTVAHARTVADQERIMGTLTKGKYTVTQKSAEKLSKDIDELEAIVTNKIFDMEKGGAVIPIKKSDIIQHLEQRQKQLFAESGSKATGKERVAAIRKEIKALKDEPDILRPSVVQRYKQDLNKETRGYWGEKETPAIEAKKELASAYRMALENIDPEIGMVNRQAKDLINAEQVLDRAVGRVRNANTTSLPTHVILSGDYKNPAFWANAAMRIKDRPGIKSWRAVRKAEKAEMLAGEAVERAMDVPKSKAGQMIQSMTFDKGATPAVISPNFQRQGKPYSQYEPNFTMTDKPNLPPPKQLPGMAQRPQIGYEPNFTMTDPYSKPQLPPPLSYTGSPKRAFAEGAQNISMPNTEAEKIMGTWKILLDDAMNTPAFLRTAEQKSIINLFERTTKR